MKRYHLFSWLRSLDNNQGQVAMIVAAFSFFLVTFTTLSIDVGHYMFLRHRLQNALDAAALAGAHALPGDRDRAVLLAQTFANNNGLAPNMIETIDFGCYVDRVMPTPNFPDPPEGPELTDVISICEQYSGDLAGFTCNAESCYRRCEFPAPGSRGGCNMIRVVAERDFSPITAPILNRLTGDALGTWPNRLESAACRGGCGTPPDLDLVMIIDRSAQLSPAQFDQIQQGALSILNSGFDANLHRCAIAVLPNPGSPSHLLSGLLPCTDQELRDQVNGIIRGGSTTDITTPILQATDLLTIDELNPDASRYIVLLTDGLTIEPTTPDAGPCQNALNAAERARAPDQDQDPTIRFYTIGYFLNNSEDQARQRCDGANDENLQNVEAHELLAMMAGTVSEHYPNCDDPGGTNENNDRDNFFCQTGEGLLTGIFNQIIQEIRDAIGPGSSLVDLSALRP